MTCEVIVKAQRVADAGAHVHPLPECAMSIPSSSFLRRALAADALVSAASALLMSVASVPLSALLALPMPLLLGAGIVLVPCAVLVGVLAACARVPRALVWGVIAANVLWALGCAALLVERLVQPTLLGEAFVIVQAITVLVFAQLEYIGLRRSVDDAMARLAAA
jgi:hypothetical protein